MAVEETETSNGENEKKDQFPVGMRVLAVDDDPTCLRVLENMLRTCKYHVTTTTKSLTALKMLKENRNKYDLVISDVEMPDMDGFKLLEHVGLEMDLPVIMLSGHSNTEFVMKGITHGACDYLLKPVRIEELKNIWQHVIRKKKFASRDTKNSDNTDKFHEETREVEQGSAAGRIDQNEKVNRKRKDQDEDEDDDIDENGQENEDASSHKKPRVVWTPELHRIFLAAVHQLGIDKAVPKKILDLMNVESLTRENVASHLQKYRLYLKRISSGESYQANMMATLRGKNGPYSRMGSFDGLGDFHALTRSAQLSNAAFGSFPPGAMLGRLNTPSGMGLRGFSSGMVQFGHASTSNNTFSDIGKLQSIVLPGNQNGNLLERMPTLELDQLQQNKCPPHMGGEFSTPIDDTSFFSLPTGSLNAGTSIDSSSNPFLDPSSNSLLLQGTSQQAQNQGNMGNQFSVGIPPLNSGTIATGVGFTSQLPDIARCNETWQGGVTLTGFTSNPLPSNDLFNPVGHPPSNLNNDFPPFASHIRCNQLDFSSPAIAFSSLQDSRRDAPNQNNFVDFNIRQENIQVPNVGSIANVVGHSINQTMQPKREENKQAYTPSSNLTCSSSSPFFDDSHSFGQNSGQVKVVCNIKSDPILINQSNSSTSFVLQQSGVEESSLETSMRSKGKYNLDQGQSQNTFGSTSSGSMEEYLLNAMVNHVK